MNKLTISNTTFDFSKKTLIMGILNVTPDSFSDGGKYIDVDTAAGHAFELMDQGADIIDIGGESTRPGAFPVSEDEEINRVIPVINEIVSKQKIPISIDTVKSRVAQLALDHGAGMINDVTALRGDEGMVKICDEYQVPVCLMHMKGSPGTMQKSPRYDDVVKEIRTFLHKQVNYALHHGVKKENIIVDPGIGFGKRTGKGIEDNCRILSELNEFSSLNCPILVGASRKKFIGNVCGGKHPLPSDERLEGSLAAACVASLHGADIIRVHDVKETRRCLDIVDCVKRQII